MSRPFARSFNRILAGVCAGVAEYLQVNVGAVRVAFLLMTAAMGGFGVVIYLGLMLLMPGPEARIVQGAVQLDDLARLIASAQRPPSMLKRGIGVIAAIGSGIVGVISFVSGVAGILDFVGFEGPATALLRQVSSADTPRGVDAPLVRLPSVDPAAAPPHPGTIIQRPRSSPPAPATIDVLVHDRLGLGQVQETLTVRIGALEGRFDLHESKPQGAIRFPLVSGERYEVAISGTTILGALGIPPVRVDGNGIGEIVVQPNQHYRVFGDYDRTPILYWLNPCSAPCE